MFKPPCQAVPVLNKYRGIDTIFYEQLRNVHRGCLLRGFDRVQVADVRSQRPPRRSFAGNDPVLGLEAVPAFFDLPVEFVQPGDGRDGI